MFGQLLRRWREERGLSLRQLAAQVNYSPGWLSKIETGAGEPTVELARACDKALDAGGDLIALAQARAQGIGRDGVPQPVQVPPGAGAGFVGREPELAALDGLLEAARSAGTVMTVAIDGPPGVGKTALAIRWAHRVAGQFPDGVLFTDLHGFAPQARRTEPAHVLEGFLAALGVPADAIPPDTEQRAAMMRSIVAGRRVLVVADNAADSAQVEPLVLGAAGCAVLVTSRRRLTGLALRHGAAQVALGPMPPPDSVALVTAVIGERAAAEPEAGRLLTQRCAHLPLALRIAAERGAARPRHRVAELAADLTADAQRLDVLEAGEDDSLAVQAAFSWSYRQIDRASARMYRLLGLHPGPRIGVRAAAALAGLPVAQTRRLMQRLESVHLVEASVPDAWSMHDLLRLYAARQAHEEELGPEREAAVRRLTEWYLLTADAAHRALAPHWHLPPLDQASAAEPTVTPVTFSGAAVARQWFDTEMDAFAAVIRLAGEHGLRAAWELPVRLWAWLEQRKAWAVWRVTHEAGLRAARAAGEREAEAWIAGNLAHAYRQLGEDAQAKSLFERARAIQEEAGYEHGLAFALIGLGCLDIEQGRADQGCRHVARALECFERRGDRFGQALAWAGLGESYGRLHQFAEAERYLGKALDSFTVLDDHYGQGYALLLWATLAHNSGDTAGASAFVERALAARRAAADTWGEAEALEQQGQFALAAGRHQDAQAAWRMALTLYERLGDPRAAKVRQRLRSLRESR